MTSTHPAARILWAFASEPRQKLALSAYALATKPLPEKMRALAVTWLVGGMGASLIRAAMRDVRSDDDDEIFDERNWDPSRLALASLTGPFQGLPLIGDVIEGGAFKLAGEWLPDGNLFSGIERGFEAAMKVPDWFTGDRDAEDIGKDVETLLGAGAPFSDNVSAASSLSHLIRDTYSILDNFIGE